MPKIRYRCQSEAPVRTPSPVGAHGTRFGDEKLPDIRDEDSFREVVRKLAVFISTNITLPSTFEQLRTTSAGDPLRRLVDHLGKKCNHPALVSALLALKWHYGAAHEDKSMNDSRASSCEIVAWRFLAHLSERETVELCLYEIPPPELLGSQPPVDEECGNLFDPDEGSPLLSQISSGSASESRAHDPNSTVDTTGSRRFQLLQSVSRLTVTASASEDSEPSENEDEDPTAPFIHLNALEIASIADAKRFLSQNIVQKIITGIWNGDIIFWDDLSLHTTKKPRFYDPSKADPFSRLRVPKYLKSFEVLFFLTFLGLYYAVLVERNPYRISVLEVLLYVWLAAFAYDELSEWMDAGSIFYAADVWNIFDVTMISIGFTFAIMRTVGLSTRNHRLVDLAFDVLALEALFMVPRVCSILSLSPYWGTLIPCLKEMGKDFIKFMILVVIIYLGFLTTFSLVGRDVFSTPEMTMALTKIFFGSSSVGFDLMDDIDPVFGPPLMISFMTLSSILLMGSLTGMLSNSFSRVITHAREEYLYVYSVYVLEASTSNRLTHFYPPFNLIALVIFRPARLFLRSSDKFRQARIVLLKVTHLPVVRAIQLYEKVCRRHRFDSSAAHFGGLRQESVIGGGLRSGRMPQRKRSRQSLTHARPSSLCRPRSGGSPAQYSEGPGGAVEAGRVEGREDEALEAPTNVEGRIAELSAKIDRLTELVVRLQANQVATLADIGLA